MHFLAAVCGLNTESCFGGHLKFYCNLSWCMRWIWLNLRLVLVERLLVSTQRLKAKARMLNNQPSWQPGTLRLKFYGRLCFFIACRNLWLTYRRWHDEEIWRWIAIIWKFPRGFLIYSLSRVFCSRRIPSAMIWIWWAVLGGFSTDNFEGFSTVLILRKSHHMEKLISITKKSRVSQHDTQWLTLKNSQTFSFGEFECNRWHTNQFAERYLNGIKMRLLLVKTVSLYCFEIDKTAKFAFKRNH